MDSAQRLKVLFLSQPFLYPLDSGGKIRTGKLLEKLRAVFDIALVSNFDPATDAAHLHHVEKLCHEFHAVPSKGSKKYSAGFYFKVLTRMFSRYPITVIGDYSRAIEKKLLNLVRHRDYDILICDFLQPTLNFKRLRGRPMLLFQHNIESVIPRRHYEVAQNWFMKLFWWLQWRKMLRYEIETCQKFSAVVTVSESDKKLLEDRYSATNVFAIPTGVDTEYFSPSEDRVNPNSLVFTGSMDWLPNEDAILFFARDILWRIKREIPDIKLTVVGKNPSARLLNEIQNYPEIDVVGWVSDVRPFIAQNSLYIIPLRIGGGTRIKVYEAMAMGKAVISTRVGVEGLPVVDGENVILADSPDDLASAIINLLADSNRRRVVERKARDFVQGNYSWGKAANVFAEICRDVVSARRSAGSFT